MKTILVSTDFSEGSENAMQHAQIIARAYGSTLIYFHAHFPMLPNQFIDPNGMSISMPVEDFQESMKSIHQSLEKWVKEDEVQGLNSKVIVKVGEVKPCLQEVLSEILIDLVIIGKTSSPSFLETLLGSTTKSLLHELEVPMLVIPANFTEDIFQQTLYASQLEFDEISFIQAANQWAKHGKKSMVLAHLNEDFETDLVPNDQFLKEIKSAMKKEELVYVQADAKSFQTGLLKLIKEQKASLICMTTHKRNILSQLVTPSKTRAAIEFIPIPTLVYYAKD
ncbi:universal stress protein [Aquirufa rosea]|uniref:UspA domain-containing protein n=1 Tax=Aquirufa rosea TaxID=2509241 RepID=A0A4Q1BX20_9BACT|nr:universal stress protein [Aquirufa rosea]RXK46536.1 hypothetical protein ESB04_11980 [Aquirufa rosea]